MKFYKVVLNITGSKVNNNKNITIYQVGKSALSVIDKVKHLPKVQRGFRKAFFSACEIDEMEYVVGVIKNPFHYTDARDYCEFTSLVEIIRILGHFEGYKFKTEEGKQLKAFCNKYKSVRESYKPLIECEYMRWAGKVIEQYNAERFEL